MINDDDITTDDPNYVIENAEVSGTYTGEELLPDGFTITHNTDVVYSLLLHRRLGTALTINTFNIVATFDGSASSSLATYPSSEYVIGQQITYENYQQLMYSSLVPLINRVIDVQYEFRGQLIHEPSPEPEPEPQPEPEPEPEPQTYTHHPQPTTPYH